MDVLKVSSKSVPSSVAGAMAGVVRQHGAVEVQVVGAGALNQAIKAVAIARGYLAPSGIDVVCVPTFVDVQIDGESRTALRLSIEDRHAAHPAHPAPARAVVDLRESAALVDGAGEPDGDGSRAPLSLEA
jgi:stage V sporulation protein S